MLVVVHDVLPISFGIAVDDPSGDVIHHKMMKRTTSIPCKKEQTFATSVDYQTKVVFEILQGEGYYKEDNHQIGLFVMEGIPPAPKGE